jgi:hypothetical protein
MTAGMGSPSPDTREAVGLGASPARLSGGDGWWLAAVPIVLAAGAYWWILDVYFEGDDFVHLYDIANLGLLGFILKGHGGHALVVCNTVFWLTHALFDLHAEGFMASVLLTHLLNVFLCYRAGVALSGGRYAASAAAALWAVAPSAAGTLGWYSVFGHALAATVLLVLLLLLARSAARTEAVAAGTVLGWLALSWIGGFCFGTGLSAALVMPVVIALLVPAVLARSATRWLLIVSPLVVLALYAAYVVAGAQWAGMPPDGLGPFLALAAAWRSNLALFFHLVLSGPTDLLLGPFVRGQPPLAAGAVALLALLVLVARLPARQRRQAAALGLVMIAAYGMIAVGRGLLGRAVMVAPRYHYLAQAPLALLLAVVVARLGAGHGSPAWRRTIVLAWVLLLAIGVARRGWPAHPQDQAKRREVEDVRTAIEAAVRATPRGTSVYLQNRPYWGGGLLVGLPQYFPGWAGVFCMLHPENTVDGRAVRFVEANPAVRQGAAIGRCGGELLVEAAPPGTKVW